MVDLTNIGKDSLVFQYEDIISTIGFNIARQFYEKNINERMRGMSLEDVLRMYFDREKEDISEWLKDEFDIDFSKEQYLLSRKSMAPNLLYARKVIKYAYDDNIRKITIHSNDDSPLVQEAIKSFGIPIKYTHGDIVPVLRENVNGTFVTSNTQNIRKCFDVGVPFALTIVDDYMYLADMVKERIENTLIQKGVHTMYTSIISAGIL